MYLGHICTVVLLPCCHPHRLSYLAFLSFLHGFVSFALRWHWISASSSRSCCVWPFVDLSIHSLWFCSNMTSYICSSEKVIFNELIFWVHSQLCPIHQYCTLCIYLTLIYESLNTNRPCDLCALDLVKKKKKKPAKSPKTEIGKKLNDSYFVIYRYSI